MSLLGELGKWICRGILATALWVAWTSLAVAGQDGLLIINAELAELNNRSETELSPTTRYSVMNLNTRRVYDFPIGRSGVQVDAEEVEEGVYCLNSVSTLLAVVDYCGEPFFRVLAGKVNNAGWWRIGYTLRVGDHPSLIFALKYPERVLAEAKKYEKDLLRKYGIEADDALIRMNPQQASVFLDRGKASYAQKDYDKALEAYDAALRINPQLADAFVARGMAWRRKGDLNRAVADYDAAIRVNPQQQFAFAERGEVWYQRTDYDRAVADFARAIEIDPRFARAYLFRGYAEQQTGNIDAAIADYSQAIAVDPTLAAAHNQLAWQLATSARAPVRDGQRAVELALKACELSEWKTSTYIDTLAAAYARNGDYAKAVEWQRKALADDPYLKGRDQALERLRLYEANKAWPPD